MIPQKKNEIQHYKHIKKKPIPMNKDSNYNDNLCGAAATKG